MAKVMEIRYLIVLLLLISSCSLRDNNTKITNLEKMLKNYSNNSYKIKTLTRNDIKNINYPLIEVRTNGILKQAIMLPLSERYGISNFTSGDGQNITKHGAIISKTYGFNVGMISHTSGNKSHFIFLTSSQNWPNETTHEYKFLTPSFGSIDVFVRCKLDPVSEEILGLSYQTTKFEEKCSNFDNDFINQYWVSDAGFVWKSKQWIGKDMSNEENVYAKLFVLKK